MQRQSSSADFEQQSLVGLVRLTYASILAFIDLARRRDWLRGWGGGSGMGWIAVAFERPYATRGRWNALVRIPGVPRRGLHTDRTWLIRVC